MKKILKKQKLELFNKVNNELQIDLNKYRNDEALGKIGKIFNIQMYSIKKIAGPILFSVFLYFLGFFSLKLVGWDYLIYGILGVIFFLLSGFFFGIDRLLTNLKKDLREVIQYGMEVFDHAVNDLELIHKKSDEFSQKENQLGLLFEGIMLGVVSPSVTKQIAGVPLVGGMVERGVDLCLYQVVNKFNSQNYKMNTSLAASGVLSFAEVSRNRFNTFLSIADKTVATTLSTARLPFRLLFAFSGIMVIVIYAIYS